METPRTQSAKRAAKDLEDPALASSPLPAIKAKANDIVETLKSKLTTGKITCCEVRSCSKHLRRL